MSVHDFARAMEAAGLAPGRVIADGQIHRCHDTAKKKINDDGWYVLHPEGYGAFGSWYGGWKETWRTNGEIDYRQIEINQLIRNEEKKRDQAQAAREAAQIWHQGKPCDSHPYLTKKGVGSYGLRSQGTALLVPMLSLDGDLLSLQRIFPPDKKRFLKGGKVDRAVFKIGDFDGAQKVVVAEGYATAASIYEATGLPVVVAFSAGNMEKVAAPLRELLPDATIIFAGDNDDSGVGQAAINKAAKAANGIAALCPIPGDFNDLHQAHGLDAVRAIIDAATVAPKQGEATAFYPAPKGSVRAAEYQMTGAMEQFMADVLAFWRSDPEPGQGNLEHILNEKVPTDSLLITPTGSGKSTIGRSYVELILDKLPGKTFAFLTPRHNLNEEQAAPLIAALGDKYKVVIHRGLSADDPKAPGEKMCRKHKEAASIRSAGGDVETMLCGTGKGKPRCELCNKCGTKRQAQENAEADIILGAHNLQTHTKPSIMGDLAAVFVDESPVDCFLGGVDGPPVVLSFGAIRDVCERLEILEQKATAMGRMAVANDFNADHMKLTALLDALKVHPEGKIKTDGLPDLKGTGRMIWRTIKELNIAPDTSPRDREAEIALKGPYNKSVLLVARLVDCVKKASGDIVPGLNMLDGGVSLAWRLERAKGWNVPTMFMDATARPEIYQALFPTIADDRITRVECAAPNMSVRQVVDFNGSRNKLVPNDKRPGQANTARNNIKRVASLIECRAAEFEGEGAEIDGKAVDVLVITYKATRELLDELGLPDNVETAHFGNLTGLDRWKGVRCVIMIGRPTVGVPDVELRAEIIKGDQIIPLPDEGHNESPKGKRNEKFNKWYVRDMVGARRRGKDTGPELPREHHTDPIAEAVRWTLNEGQLIQSIGRGREIRRTKANPLQVDIITDVPLPLEVDEFLTWKQVQPSPFATMAARGVIMDCPMDVKKPDGFWNVVAAGLPDVFEKKQAAKDWADKNSLAVENAYRDISISKVYRERINGRAKVKVGSNAVPILYRAGTDLSALFPDAEITIIAEPRSPLPSVPPIGRAIAGPPVPLGYEIGGQSVFEVGAFVLDGDNLRLEHYPALKDWQLRQSPSSL